MAVPVELPRAMEASVRFVEETPPEQLVEATLSRLKGGESSRELLAACALAVSRSTELPADHHGGPVHPVSGIHAIDRAAAWLDGDWAMMPVVHSVALANRHVNSPEMGPTIMPALEAASSRRSREEVGEAFRTALRRFEPVLAQRLLLELLESHEPAAILDLMFETALRRNGLDDHYFLYAVHSMRALECIGWEWASVVLRPVVRYLSTNMRAVVDPESGFRAKYVEGNLAAYNSFHLLEALVEQHGLLAKPLRAETGDDESAGVGELGERIAETTRFAEIPGLLAGALADGLSLAGAGEALSYGAALLHLRTDYGNPFDVHLHTGVNTRRYVLGLPGVCVRNKLLALLSWAYGPEIRLCEGRVAWPWRFDTAAADGLDQETLLDAIVASIVTRPAADTSISVEQLYCGPQVKRTIALSQAYTDRGYDAKAFFQRMGELVCRDDYSEMHAFKHLQAALEEYETTREPYRWAHLVSTAKMAWCTYGFAQDIYDQARPHLAI